MLDVGYSCHSYSIYIHMEMAPGSCCHRLCAAVTGLVGIHFGVLGECCLIDSSTILFEEWLPNMADKLLTAGMVVYLQWTQKITYGLRSSN